MLHSKEVYNTDHTTSRDPYEGGDQHDDTDDVVPQEAQYVVYIDVLYYVPETFHHILYRFLADTLPINDKHCRIFTQLTLN